MTAHDPCERPASLGSRRCWNRARQGAARRQCPHLPPSISHSRLQRLACGSPTRAALLRAAQAALRDVQSCSALAAPGPGISRASPAQVMPILARVARATDVVVLNWGLHYSKGYVDQLRVLTQQVRPCPAGPVPARVGLSILSLLAWSCTIRVPCVKRQAAAVPASACHPRHAPSRSVAACTCF